MNKPQYLAELSQLLIFMTHADREKTLARYGALFDAAGPEGQDALLIKLGSTTRQAIRLSRIYDVAGYQDEELDSLEAEAKAPPAPKPGDPSAEPDAARFASLMGEDLPDFELPDLPEEPETPDVPGPEPESAPGPESAPVEGGLAVGGDAAGEAAKGGGEDDADYEALWGKRPAPPEKAAPAAPESKPGPGEEPEPEASPAPDLPAPAVRTVVERVIPLWLGLPLFVLTVVFIALPVGALCLALLPILLIPGLAVLLGAWLAFVGGLWCIGIIADAAVLFGSALILLALGLLILWCGLWLDVAMASGFVRALRALAHLTLGRKVTVHA